MLCQQLTITEVVVEMTSAQLLGEFWASHILKVRGSGNFRENGCERVFCKKKIIIAVRWYQKFQLWFWKLSCSVTFTFSLFLASSNIFRKINFFYNIETITNVNKNSIFLFKQSFLQYLSNSLQRTLMNSINIF